MRPATSGAPFLVKIDIQAQLTPQKTVISNDGGTAVANDLQAKIDSGNVPWNVAQTVSAGSRTASETTLRTYTAGSWGGGPSPVLLSPSPGSITTNTTFTIVPDGGATFGEVPGGWLRPCSALFCRVRAVFSRTEPP